MTRYFVKDGKIHTYPVSSDCDIEYKGERLYDYITDIHGNNEMCYECSISLTDIFVESVAKLSEETMDCWSHSVGNIPREKKYRSEG